jgi:hypothetical protein
MNNNIDLKFGDWFTEMSGSTGAVFDPKQKPKEDWNWQGTPGTTGVSPKKGPIIKEKNEKK